MDDVGKKTCRLGGSHAFPKSSPIRSGSFFAQVPPKKRKTCRRRKRRILVAQKGLPRVFLSGTPTATLSEGEGGRGGEKPAVPVTSRKKLGVCTEGAPCIPNGPWGSKGKSVGKGSWPRGKNANRGPIWSVLNANCHWETTLVSGE